MKKYGLYLFLALLCLFSLGCDDKTRTSQGDSALAGNFQSTTQLRPKDDVFFLLGNTLLDTNGFTSEVGILNNDENDLPPPRTSVIWNILFLSDLPENGVLFPDDGDRGSRGQGTDGPVEYLPNTGFRGLDRIRYFMAAGANRSVVLSESSATVEFRVGPLVWYVDNTKSGGDGSQRKPFSTLAEAVNVAEENDIIFVLAGDGTSKGLDTPVALKRGQRLMGEGVGLAVNVALNTPVEINPGTSPSRTIIPTGTPARLTGPVTLADNCLVEGLSFNQSPGDTIVGQSIQNTTIRNNSFQGGLGLTLKLTDCSGALRFTNNSIQEPGTSLLNCLETSFQAQTATLDISNNTFADGAAIDPANAVLVVASGSSNVTFTSNNNTLTTPNSSTTYDRFLQASVDSTATLSVSAEGNSVPVQTTGFELSSTNSSGLNCTFRQNNVTATNDGITVTTSSSQQTSVTATSNQLTVNQTTKPIDESDGLSPLEFKSNNAGLILSASGNTLSGGSDGIFLLAIGGTVSGTIENNALENQEVKPLFMRTAASAVGTLRVLGNTLTNQPANDGVEIRSTEDSRLNLAYRNNIGLFAFLAASNSSNLCLDATGNTWTDLTLEGALTAMLTVERLDAPNGGPLETVNTVNGIVSVNGNATPAAAGACNIE